MALVSEDVCGSCKWRKLREGTEDDYTCMNRKSPECYDYVPWWGTCDKWEADENETHNG